MEKGIFEKIVDKEVSSHIVYEDDMVLAFLSVPQKTKGHTLVIPKKRYENIMDIPDDILENVIKVVKKLSKAVMVSCNADGIKIVQNNGSAADQVVFHIHFHIIPRKTGDPISQGDRSTIDLDDSEYTKIQQDIIKNIN